jgi:maltose O-acetyltransferase
MAAVLRALERHRQAAAITRRFPTTVIEDNVVIKGKITNLTLGQGVIIQSGTVLHLGGMNWCGNAGCVDIGDGSVISPNCVLYGAGPGGVHIGRKFDCGPGVGIFASRTDYRKGPDHHIFAPVNIGDEVIVFANAVIGPGVRIGNGAVIAACSVVTRDIPENCLAGGSPAVPLQLDVRRTQCSG